MYIIISALTTAKHFIVVFSPTVSRQLEPNWQTFFDLSLKDEDFSVYVGIILLNLVTH